MKNLYTCLLSLIALSSCNSYNKIITIDDPFKNEKNIRLIQELEGYSDEKRGRLFDGSDYMVTLKSMYSKPAFQKGQVTTELISTTNTRSEDLDSLVFIEANGEIFRFHSNKYASRQFTSHSSSTQTTTSVEKEKDKQDDGKEKQNITVTTESSSSGQSRQIMKRTIEISPDNWHKLSNLETMKVRFYIGKEGVDVHFTSRDRKKLAGFYNEVIAFEKSLNQHVSL